MRSFEKIFINVILPISKPGIAAVGVYAFMCAWNEYLYSLILLTTEEKYTISLGLSRFITEFGTYWESDGSSIYYCNNSNIAYFYAARKKSDRGSDCRSS